MNFFDMGTKTGTKPPLAFGNARDFSGKCVFKRAPYCYPFNVLGTMAGTMNQKREIGSAGRKPITPDRFLPHNFRTTKESGIGKNKLSSFKKEN